MTQLSSLNTHQSTNHPIQLLPWQLKAKSLILPMVPQPRLSGDGCAWIFEATPIDYFWSAHDEPGDRVYAKLLYKVGDRFYDCEKWAEHDGEILHWIRPKCEVAKHESNWLAWQSPGSMPPKVSREWREITGVRIMQFSKLSEQEIRQGNIPFNVLANPYCPSETWIYLLDVVKVRSPYAHLRR